jgi:competence protein ComEC
MIKGYVKWLIFAAVTLWVAVLFLPDNKLHVVFCDVGQGDAILVTYKTNQLLVDGGPGKKILGCLEKHLPFYDRRIEAVILTHQNWDHSNGLAYVRQRYKIVKFEPVLRQGQLLEIGPIRYQVLWPTDNVLAASTIGTENDDGIVGKVSFGDFDVLLTADVTTMGYENPGPDIEVVKVPHHGSKSGWEPEWWVRAKPALAVISVGKNSFGHPAPEVIKLL